MSHVFNKTNIFNGNSISLNNKELHYLLHSKLLNAYDATNALALTWNATISNYTSDQLHSILNQSWKDMTESNHMFVKSLQYNLENAISPYKGLAVSNILYTHLIRIH